MPNRKHITFTCPNGRKCRDSSLHDETFLKENLEALLLYRQATGFCPTTPEPDEGWMGELVAGWFRVAADLERDEGVAAPHAAHLDGQQTASPGGAEENGHGPEIWRQSGTQF